MAYKATAHAENDTARSWRRYRRRVTAAAAYEPPAQPPHSPAEIRASLLPEEADAFDRDYREALKTAAETLNLDELHATLQHWRRIALMTQTDPAAHRRMLAQADETLRTGQLPPGTASLDEVKALIKERLGLAARLLLAAHQL